MASLFSGADHIDHVGTQIPYTCTVGAVIAVLYILYGFFRISPVIMIPAGIIALYFLQIILHNIFMKKYGIDAMHLVSAVEDLTGKKLGVAESDLEAVRFVDFLEV